MKVSGGFLRKESIIYKQWLLSQQKIGSWYLHQPSERLSQLLSYKVTGGASQAASTDWLES